MQSTSISDKDHSEKEMIMPMIKISLDLMLNLLRKYLLNSTQMKEKLKYLPPQLNKRIQLSPKPSVLMILTVSVNMVTDSGSGT